MVTQVTRTVMGANAISANNIADNAIVSRHLGDDVILARHIEDSFIPTGTTTALNSLHANSLTAIANVNTVTANVNTVKANVDAAEANIAGILNGAIFSGSILLEEGLSLGVSNVNPITSSVTLGSPANIMLNYGTSANPVGGNVVIGVGNGDVNLQTAFRLDVRGTANVGALTATSLSGPSSIVISDGGTVGSATTTDAITIASDGIVTFKDDIKIKNDGTIGSAGAATAMTIDSSGIVTFVDDIKIKNDGTIGSAGAATAMTIASDGVVTFVDDIKIKDGGTIGSATTVDAMTVASDGIVTFKDDIKIKDVGTIGSATTPAAITIAGDGAVTLADDLTITGNLTVSGDTVSQDVTNLTVEDRIILAAKNASGTPSLDAGLMVSRGAQGNVFIGYDESVNKVVLAHTSSPHTNTSISATSAANLDARHMTAESLVLSGDAGVLVPNDGNIGSAGSTAAIQIASDGVVTFVDDIKIKDGGTIGSATTVDAMTVASDGIVTFKDDIKIKDGGTIGNASVDDVMTLASTGIVTFKDDIVLKNDVTIGTAGAATAMTIDSSGIVTFVDDIKIKDGGTVGSATTAGAITIASDGIVTFVDDIKIKDGGTIGSASAAGAITISAAGKTDLLSAAVATGLGVAGNTAPAATHFSLGTPANAIIRTHTASGTANIIVGDATATSSYNLDVRGTANVGAFITQGVDPLANDLATFTRLNANINVVQDNVSAITGTTLAPATNVITSVAGANAYGIGAAVTVIARTRVLLSGINQLPTTDYVVPSSGVMQLTDPAATIPAGIPIQINYWN